MLLRICRMQHNWAALSKLTAKYPGKIELCSSSSPIRVGIKNPRSIPLLETLVADPVSPNRVWLNALKKRNKSKPNLVSYGSEFNVVEKPQFTHYFLPSKLLEKAELMEIQKVDDLDGCHMYVQIHDTEIIPFPSVQVTDTSEPVNRNQVNLAEASNAISNSDVDMWRRSNVPEFVKLLEDCIGSARSSLETSVVRLVQEENDISQQLAQLETQNAFVDDKISQWNKQAHRELQTSFQEHMDSYVKKHLQWWTLYYRVPNTKDMLNDVFMQTSINDFNYTKGCIDTTSRTGAGSLRNPLIDIKNKLLDVSLESGSLKIVVAEFIKTQLPLIAVAWAGVYFEQFDLYSMGALGGLGMVLGFRNVSKKWYAMLDRFKDSIFDETRIAIDEMTLDLGREWKENYSSKKLELQSKKQVLEE